MVSQSLSLLLVYVKVNKKQRRQACLKAFETLYKQWVTFNRKFKNITLAKTFRHTNTTQALYHLWYIGTYSSRQQKNSKLLNIIFLVIVTQKTVPMFCCFRKTDLA